MQQIASSKKEIEVERQEKRKRRSAQIEGTYMYVGCGDNVFEVNMTYIIGAIYDRSWERKEMLDEIDG